MNASWTTIYEVSDPEASTLTVKNLIPYMEYSLRLVAHNVKGPSPPSLPTKTFQTIQARPSHPPQNVTIRAFEFTKLNVRWIPLSQQDWLRCAPWVQYLLSHPRRFFQTALSLN